jgi:hypothetical protein
MKLEHFKHHQDYWFVLTFENGELKTILEQLISQYVSPETLNTARINTEWGCLKFKQGMVDRLV